MEPPTKIAAEEQAVTAIVLESIRARRRSDNHSRWMMSCPQGLRETDWGDSRLLPFEEPIQRILKYELANQGLLASGPTGRGKSRAMWQLMRRLGEQGHDIRFWAASDWFTALQDNLRYGRDDARGWVEAVARRHIVFIDDLGQEAITAAREEWAQAWFFRFLDIRVGERLPLFVTTNLGAEDFACRAGGLRGDPFLRRLLDVCKPVRFETADERRSREGLVPPSCLPRNPRAC